MFTGDIHRQRVSRMRGESHWRWHLDEMYVWRAMDHKLAVLGAGCMQLWTAMSGKRGVQMRLSWLVVAASSFLTTPAFAHGGGLNAEGCHNDRNGGTGYHCHRGGGSRGGSALRAQSLIGGGGATCFANCSAARAAGAARARRVARILAQARPRRRWRGMRMRHLAR
jgi:hypothetical protein